MGLRIPWTSRRRRKRPWLASLDKEQRRRLARNLRELVESKLEIDRRLNESARPR